MMSNPFSKVVILGGGMVSGSLALALQGQTSRGQGKSGANVSSVWAELHGESPERQVKLWQRRAGNTKEAISLGIDATNSLNDAIANADLLILDAPLSAMARLVASALEAGLPSGCLITDLASVKQKPHEVMREALRGRAQTYIGSHPVLNKEQGDIHSASAHLFEGTTCLLTNDEDASTELMQRLEAFWQALGCHTAWLNAPAHDALVARISHVPHIVAAAAAHACLHSPDLGIFGGGGLSDTTRVAAGNPEMWTEILNENRDAIEAPLCELISELQHIHDTLKRSDQATVRQWLTAAKERRDRLKTEI